MTQHPEHERYSVGLNITLAVVLENSAIGEGVLSYTRGKSMLHSLHEQPGLNQTHLSGDIIFLKLQFTTFHWNVHLPAHPTHGFYLITSRLQAVPNLFTLGGCKLDPCLGWGTIASLEAGSSDRPENKVKSAHGQMMCSSPSPPSPHPHFFRTWLSSQRKTSKNPCIMGSSVPDCEI